LYYIVKASEEEKNIYNNIYSSFPHEGQLSPIDREDFRGSTNNDQDVSEEEEARIFHGRGS
jgi:hypothetical protein